MSGAGPAGTETKGPFMTPTDTHPDGPYRAVRQGIAVLAAFVVVALGLSAPSLAQDLASSAVAVTPVPAEAPVNFSLLGLFLSADWIVKIVMLGLLAASIWCWAIIIDKSLLFTRATREMNRFERVFWSGQSLEELYQSMAEKPSFGLGSIFVAAMKEWKRSHEQGASSYLGVHQRLEKVLAYALPRPEIQETEKLYLAALSNLMKPSQSQP